MKPLSFTSNPTDNGRGLDPGAGKSARNTPRWPRPDLTVIRGPVTDPWGLAEMPVENPDGTRIVPGEAAATLSAATRGRINRRGKRPFRGMGVRP